MKEISLKSIQNQVNYNSFQNPSTATSNHFLQSDLVQTTNCPETPYFFIRLQSLIRFVLPQQAFKAFPGSLLKRWLLNWYQKVIDDYNEISSALVERINSLANAYYNWMENFMEMEHDNYPSAIEIMLMEPNAKFSKAIENSFPVNSAAGFKYTLIDTINAMAAGFEKTLIIFLRIFNSGTEFQNPKLEIVNLAVINVDITIKEKTFADVRPERKFNELLQNFKNYIPDIFLINKYHFSIKKLWALKWPGMNFGQVLNPMLSVANMQNEVPGIYVPLKYPH